MFNYRASQNKQPIWIFLNKSTPFSEGVLGIWLKQDIVCMNRLQKKWSQKIEISSSYSHFCILPEQAPAQVIDKIQTAPDFFQSAIG